MENNELKKNAMLPVVMISLAVALRQMSMTIVMPFISTYCKGLSGYTPLLAGLAVGIFGLMQALLQIPFGILSDRHGNKKMVLIGLTLVVVGLILAYSAKNVGLLIFARALQGSGAVIGVAYSWVAGMVDKSKMTEAMSILGAFVSAAAALAFAAGPLLRGIMSVNYMFLTCAILLFLNELYILFFLKDNGKKADNKTPQRGHIRIILKNKTFVIMNLAAFINNFMMISVFYAAPIYLSKVTGEKGMWEVFVPAIIAAILVMKAAATFADKGFSNQVLAAAFLVSALSIFFYFEKSSFVFLLLGTTFFMCGYISLATIVATNVNRIVEDSYRGTANGIFNSFQYVGSFAGAVVTGAAWGISEKLAWIIVIAVGTAGLLMIAFCRPDENKNKNEGPSI